jgi:uncharacterized iron-regulated membrane protein
MKKMIRNIHLWLGLASGIIVLIVAITGCLYVFVDELKPIIYKDRYFINKENTAEKKLPMSKLLLIAQEELGEENHIQRVQFTNLYDRTYVFSSFKKK